MANFSKHCFLWIKAKIYLFTRTCRYHVSLASVAQKPLFRSFKRSFAAPLRVSLEKEVHNFTLVLWTTGIEAPNQPLWFLSLGINIDSAHPLNVTMQQCSRWLLQAVRLRANVSMLLTFPMKLYTFSSSMWTNSPLPSHPWSTYLIFYVNVIYSDIICIV